MASCSPDLGPIKISESRWGPVDFLYAWCNRTFISFIFTSLLIYLPTGEIKYLACFPSILLVMNAFFPVLAVIIFYAISMVHSWMKLHSKNFNKTFHTFLFVLTVSLSLSLSFFLSFMFTFYSLLMQPPFARWKPPKRDSLRSFRQTRPHDFLPFSLGNKNLKKSDPSRLTLLFWRPRAR